MKHFDGELKVSDFELDQLKETVNIGASHASTALSQLTKKRIGITVPEVHIDSVEKSIDYVGAKEKISTSVIVNILGDSTGIMFFLFKDNNGQKLAHLITKGQDGNEMLTEEDRSVLSEVGNILSGACLTALSKFLGINMLHSVSEVVTDILGSIINSVVKEIRKASDVALVFKVTLSVDGEDIETDMFFLMDPEFTDRVLSLTQKQFNR